MTKLGLVLLVAVTALPLAAQQAKSKSNAPHPAATISKDSARTVALAHVPGGKVSQAELEKEDGRLLWSFDLKVAGRPGVEEVQVDALTGAFIKQEHESPAAEAKERSAEKAKKKPAP
ncbi:MAG: PepSY domain-containing protein [Gemmatimonadaceae bacterium]